MADITVVGGGLAGMVAAITAAEQGAKVHLYERTRPWAGGPAPARRRSSPMMGLMPSTTMGRSGRGWPTAT
jgi:succinate dehydrogenase/fumarate reductase flavoprotein subunit